MADRYHEAALRWPWAWCAALGAVAAWFAWFPITDTDIWWHLAAGREMVARGGWLRTDPFSFTLDRPVWIDLHWLFQLFVYGVYRVSGAVGLVTAKVLVVGCAWALLCAARKDRAYVAAAAVGGALMAYEVRYQLVMRPAIVTLLCIAAFLVCLERHRATAGRRWLWALIPVQVVWTNTQGLFVLGPVLVAGYLAGQVLERLLARRLGSGRPHVADGLAMPLVVAAVGTSLACLVNPYGPRGALFPLELFRRIDPAVGNVYSRNVVENMPLLELTGTDVRYLYAVVFVTLVLAVSFWLNRRDLCPAHVLLGGAFLALAWMAHRNVVLYLFVATMLLGANVPNALRLVSSRLSAGVAGPVLLVSLALIGIDGCAHSDVMRAYPSGSMVSPFTCPDAAVDYLESEPVAGNIFNADRYGGYLIWRRYPPHQVFIDTRLVIRSPRFFAEYLAILDNPALFDGVADRFGVTHVLLPTGFFSERYVALVDALYGSERWAAAFTDGSSMLFVRADLLTAGEIDLSDTAQVDSIRSALELRWSGDDEIRRQAVFFLEELVARLGSRPAAPEEGYARPAPSAAPLPEGVIIPVDSRLPIPSMSPGKKGEITYIRLSVGDCYVFCLDLSQKVKRATGLWPLASPPSAVLLRRRTGLSADRRVSCPRKRLRFSPVSVVRSRSGIHHQLPYSQEALCSCVPS